MTSFQVNLLVHLVHKYTSDVLHLKAQNLKCEGGKINIKPTIIFDNPGFVATAVLRGDGVPHEDDSLVLAAVGANFPVNLAVNSYPRHLAIHGPASNIVQRQRRKRMLGRNCLAMLPNNLKSIFLKLSTFQSELAKAELMSWFSHVKTTTRRLHLHCSS